MLCLLDFEASSLANDSYPIEVAWCSHDLAQGFAAVIRPVEAWRPRYAWSALSERVHGLGFDVVTEKGAPAADVARQVVRDLLHAGMIVSDNPEHDNRWLGKLAAVAVDAEQCPGVSGMALDAMLTAREKHLRLSAPIGDQPARRWADEIGLVHHVALHDVIRHALRLGVIALEEIRVNHGDSAAQQVRDCLTGRARALLARWRRPTKE